MLINLMIKSIIELQELKNILNEKNITYTEWSTEDGNLEIRIDKMENANNWDEILNIIVEYAFGCNRQRLFIFPDEPDFITFWH